MILDESIEETTAVAGPSNKEHLTIAPTRSGCCQYFPSIFQDFLPSNCSGLPSMPVAFQDPIPPLAVSSPLLSPEADTVYDPVVFETEPDDFGLY